MEIELKNPNIRHVSDMKDVLFDKEWFKVCRRQRPVLHVPRDKTDGQPRYDITVIPPFIMGNEFVKTLGHFHGEDSNEMYIILEGEGLFIFQKGKDAVEDFYAVKGEKGEAMIVPKGYAHVTINPSKTETLKMANWVREASGFDYESVEKKGGLCYFYTTTAGSKTIITRTCRR